MAEIYDKRLGKVIIRRHARAKYVRLSVAPSGTLSISAPLYTPVFFIKKFINNSRQEIEMILETHTTAYKDQMVIGKSHSIEVTTAKTTNVYYKKPRIIVELAVGETITDFETQLLIRPVIVKALRAEAKAYLPRRLDYLAENHGFEYNKLRFSHARSRWGSCSSDSTISLNIALMKLPFDLIDYVMIHELVHTRYLNHSQQFWATVGGIDPDYKLKRKTIKKHSPHI